MDAKDWGSRVLSNPGLDLDNSPAPDDGYISEVFVESDNEEMTGESKSQGAKKKKLIAMEM